jgi:hypothetical protein
MSSLTDTARQAVADFPGSDVEVAIAFFASHLPAFVGTSNDRLLKAGRSIRSLIELEWMAANQESNDADASAVKEEENQAINFTAASLDTSLELLLDESKLLLSGLVKVPKVGFGKTNLQMPIVTLGCMRFQEEWGPRIDKMVRPGNRELQTADYLNSLDFFALTCVKSLSTLSPLDLTRLFILCCSCLFEF